MTAELFQLAPLHLGESRQRFRVEPLPDNKLSFSLPGFDEYGAGKDTMLGRLERARWGDMGIIEGSPGPEASDVRKISPLMVLDDVRTDPDDQAIVEAEHDGPEVAYLISVSERLGSEAGPSRPRTFKPIRTWDDQGLTAAAETDFGEARLGLFEAISTIVDQSLAIPQLHARSKQSRPVPADSAALLSLLVQATMGTTTTRMLRWDRQRAIYAWGSGGDRVEGLSQACSASAAQRLLDIATAMRRLDQLLDEQISGLSSTHHALLHAVSTYLSFVKERLAAAISDKTQDEKSDWINWSSRLGDISELLGMLLEIMGWPPADRKPTPLPSRPSSLLSQLYSQLLARQQSDSPASASSPLTVCLAYLLQQASAPVLALLHTWVGLADAPLGSEAASESSNEQPWADLGITRHPRPRQVRHGDDGDVRWDYDFSAKRMPAVIPREVRRQLFEAGRSLRLLREAKEDHPLSHNDWNMKASWGWTEAEEASRIQEQVSSHARQVKRDIKSWSHSIRHDFRPLSSSASSNLHKARIERKRIPTEFITPSSSSAWLRLKDRNATDPDEVSQPAPNTPDVEGEFAAFLASLDIQPGSAPASTSVWTATPLDSLHAFLARHADCPLLPPAYPTMEILLQNHLLAPLLAHAELVSAALVQLYLDELHLLDHLDVLHAFWLGGDVGFSERVSAALFGTEDQLADRGVSMGRRARTRARMGLAPLLTTAGSETGGDWGIALGVGLSDRQRWPPGGAELAYALRTTLINDTGAFAGEGRAGSVWEGIEDRVSFAIKPLPEDDGGVRSKWMDPQAIEALDFLHLAYSPPQAMSVVLPRDILAKYQTIHNFLLRLCRVDAAVRSVYFDLNKPYDEVADEDGKSGVDATQPHRPGPRRPLSSRRTVISADPASEALVHRLQLGMSHFISALMRYVIDTAIGANWARMRRRLERLGGRDREVENASPDSGFENDADDLDVGFGADSLADEDASDGHLDDSEPVHQLKSVHSLVVYHHLTLDRIMQACMLGSSAAYQVTYKLLMRLCGLVLDFGKIVKEIELRMEDLARSSARLREIDREWDEKTVTFTKALERLANKSGRSSRREEELDRGDEVRVDDLDMLLQDERDGSAAAGAARLNELQELVLRLRLGFADIAHLSPLEDV